MSSEDGNNRRKEGSRTFFSFTSNKRILPLDCGGEKLSVNTGRKMSLDRADSLRQKPATSRLVRVQRQIQVPCSSPRHRPP